MQPLRNFINGVFVPAVSGSLMDTTNPATGEVITQLPLSKAEDVALATQAACNALPGWKSTTLEERIEWLEKIADVLEEKSEDIARLETLDTGKPISLSRRVDAYRSVANFRFFAEHATELPNLQYEANGAVNHVHRSPVGCVGLITPWNLPLYLLSWKVAPALLMGNTIVAKPSEMTPLTANLLAETMAELGLPHGVFNLVHGLGPDVGQAIVEHPDIQAISFTGGTATGRIVAATAAPMFKKLSLELGGKNATVLLDDAPLDSIMDDLVRASFTNSGQVCLAGSRILVHNAIYDEFEQRFVEAVNALVVGDPQDEQTQMGAVISRDHQSKVESYITLGLEEGGRVIAGGTSAQVPFPNLPSQGAFIRPTVIAGLPISCRTATEEIFGPVVTLHRFNDEDEAVAMVNATDYGLAGSVWTASANRGHAFAQRMDSGIVWVNTWLNRDLRTPFGGVKQSGVGREGGLWSMNFFSELTNVCVQR
ncbi:MAG: aldehyde dehydrogenase [Candidatus Poseidonia sp.]|nr:aldehyde dehydrogenase [Poseidonia sp.]